MIATDAHVPGLTPKQAHDRVATEVRAGRMPQPGTCAVCDAKARTWGHHWRGYEYPLDVWWVCSSCNRLLTCHDGSVSLEEARAAMPALKAGERTPHTRGAGRAEQMVPVTAADLRRMVPTEEDLERLLKGI